MAGDVARGTARLYAVELVCTGMADKLVSCLLRFDPPKRRGIIPEATSNRGLQQVQMQMEHRLPRFRPHVIHRAVSFFDAALASQFRRD